MGRQRAKVDTSVCKTEGFGPEWVRFPLCPPSSAQAPSAAIEPGEELKQLTWAKQFKLKIKNIPDGKKRLAGQLEVGSIGRHNTASAYGVGNMIFNYIRRMNPSGLGTRLENGGLGQQLSGGRHLRPAPVYIFYLKNKKIFCIINI